MARPYYGRYTPQQTNGTFKFKDFAKLVNSVSPKKGLFILGLLLSLITSGASLIVPQITKSLVDTSGISSIDFKMIIMLVFTFIAYLGFGTLGGYILRYVGETSVKTLREKLWHHLLHLPVNYFDENKSGESSSRLVSDTARIKELVTSHLPNFITGSIQLVGSVVILFIMDWQMAALMFAIVPVIFIIMIPVGKIMQKIGRQLQLEMATFNAETSEKVAEIRLIKASNGESVEKANAQDSINKIFKLGLKDAKIDAILQPIMMTVMMAMFVGILGYGAIRVQEGTLSNGQLVAFLLYLYNIMNPATTFATFFSKVQRVMGSTERIQEILSTNIEVDNGSLEVDVVGKSIIAKDVSFAYKKDTPILKNISFEAKPNTVVAIAGPSGGGKSTIFSLLERFYQPTSGTIKIGDVDIQDLTLSNWRSQIGFVSQDSAVLDGSIKDNLIYGLEQEVSEARMWQVLELAYADQFVKDFDEGLETQIGERGIKLSGGQKQRLAIARAFLRDPKILMLDEATASLDSQSEHKVQKALYQLMQGRTTLVIAHRLSTIVEADQIYFVEKGEITGHGTHRELLNNHQLYAQYVSEQMIEYTNSNDYDNTLSTNNLINI